MDLKYFINELNNNEKKELINDINGIDKKFMNNLYVNSFFDEKIDSNKISSVEVIDNIDTKSKSEYKKIALKSINNGEYGICLMAGGLASRLGLNIPKGCLELNINNKKISLFEIFINQIKKYNIRLYIMLSNQNEKYVLNFFEKNKYFNYKDNIVFFTQDSLPILDLNGNYLLKDKSHVLYGPNGNGDVYKALKRSNSLDDMINHNIKYVHFSNIDNPLLDLVDLVYIGYFIKNNLDVIAKTIYEKNMKDTNRVYCKYNNKYKLVEHTYIKDDNRCFNELNMGSYIITTNELIKYSKLDLKYHRAFKKNIYIDETGNKVISDGPNSFKFEKFIYDAFYYSDKFILYEDDYENFMPIKTFDDIKKIECMLEKESL